MSSLDDATMDKVENRYRVPALENGLNMLMLFGQHRDELSFSEVCQRMGMPKASAYRAVQTLDQMGFLERNAVTGCYRLGISVLRLGFDYLSSMDIVQIGQPVIHRLRDLTGCSTHLCVRDGRDVVYVARAGAVGEIGAGVAIGSRLPAHCTAIGRVLLMTLPATKIATLFPEAAFSSTSRQGPRTPPELQQLLDADAERGHVISESFYQPGVSAVAFPLRDRDGAVLASISVMVPQAALPPTLKTTLCAQVSAAAQEIDHFIQATC